MFRFSISELGVCLGKSPSTIRSWERKGRMQLPRVGAKRSFELEQIEVVARAAHDGTLITSERLARILAALEALKKLEK